jgi:prepilin-type N-terminal cleavage/methylation domain-containing protein
MMKHRARRHYHSRGHAGFTVVECLIGLIISAMLMTALAVVFDASVINYTENEEMFESINHARQALARMTAEIRTADGVSFTAPANQCIFISGADPTQLITFEYRDGSDPGNPNTLMLITNGNAYTLCDDVTAASFTKTQASSDPNDPDSKSVLISMTVQCGSSQRTLSAAAVVRRAL